MTTEELSGIGLTLDAMTSSAAYHGAFADFTSTL